MTVAATVAAGFALANPALAAAGPAANVTQSLSASTVQANIYDTLTVKATDSTGTAVADGTAVSVTVTETATTNPGLALNTGTATATNSGTTWTLTDTTDYTTASGVATIKIRAAVAGTVTVTSKVGNISPTSNNSFTVTGGKDGAANVSKIVGVPTSAVTQYVSDGAPTFEPVPADSDGNGVTGVDGDVYYSVSGTTPITATACTPPAGTDTPADIVSAQSYAFGCDLSTLTAAGTDTITYWVDQAGGTAGKLDTGEPSATVTVNILATPTYNSDVAASTLTATDEVQTGKATTIPFTMTVLQGTTPVPGVMVRLDISGSAGVTGSFQGKTDSNGQFSKSVDVTAAQAVAGKTIIATPYVTGLATGGTAGTADTVTVTNPSVTLSLNNATAPFQAVDGGTVSIPVKVGDQFNNSYAGDALSYAVAVGGRNANKGGSAGTIGANGTAVVSYADTGVSGTSDSVTITDTTRSLTLGPLTVNYVASVTPTSITWKSTPGPVTETVNGKTIAALEYVAEVKAGATDLTNQSVTFGVNNGFIATASGAAGTSTLVVPTTSNGTATVYLGSTKTGTATLTAKVGALSPINTDTTTAPITPTITYTSDDAVKAVVTGPANVLPGTSVTYTATLTDQFGNRVSPTSPAGTNSVTWTKTGPGTLAGAPSTDTDANGQATMVLVAASNDNGKGTITATSAHGVDPKTSAAPVGTVNYNVGASTPSKVTVTPINGVKAGGTETVTAKVVDQFGNPSANTTVVFQVSGANTVSGSAMTGSGGVAAFTYKAARAGKDTIKATAAGTASGSATVTIASAATKKVETPKISVSSRTKGKVVVTVTTHPAFTKGMVVSIYKNKHGHWVKAGHVKVNAAGRGQVTLRSASGVHLIIGAKGNSGQYIEHMSKAHKVTVK